MIRYPVKKRDTLWSIGQEYGISVDELARANGLRGRQVHMLRIDQILLIPERAGKSPKTTLELNFKSLDFSIVKPEKIIVECDGCTTDFTLDPTNLLKLPIYDYARGLKVWIEGPDKKLEPVFDAESVPVGKWALSLDSRMVKAKGELQPKRGVSTSSTAEVKQAVKHNSELKLGTFAEQQVRVEAGAPVHGIATIYTKDNFRLAPSNEKYRALIVEAANKYGLTPQSIAAMISAEAWKNEKTEEWLEESNKRYPDRAQGLCQFFEPGWVTVFEYQKSLLHMDTQNLSQSARLSKRLVAKYAIDGIAAYGAVSLDAFEKQTGLSVSSLPAEEKAKFVYLLHHEGVYGSKRLLGLAGELTKAQWRQRLSNQLGHDDEAVDKILEQYENNSQLAYRGWFFSLIDAKINVNHFVVTDGEAFASPPRSMSAIVSSLALAPATQKQTAKSSVTKPPPPKPAPKVASKTVDSAQTKPVQKPKNDPPKVSPQPAQTATISNSLVTPPQGTVPKWSDPLSTCTLRSAGLGPIGARFGWTRKNGTKNHQGIDLIAIPGTPIYAVANGKVYTAPSTSSTYAYGNTLILEVGIDDLPPAQAELFKKVNPNAHTIGFFYAHLSELPEKSPLHVYAGDPIGKTGESGNAKGMNTVATGAHLHFEVRLKPFVKTTGLANRTDPLPFLKNCTNA